VKTTRYFDFIRVRPDRNMIKMEWIEQVVREPIYESVQADGRIRCWGRIEEAGGKILRIILLADRETVHNAFFDRSFRRSE
jgi:hypothetical protein